MKKTFLNNLGVLALGAAALAFAAPASACVGSQCPTSSTTTAANLPAPVHNTSGFNFGWQALSQGAGAAEWSGVKGSAFADKDGFLKAEAKLDASGNGCVNDCGTTSWGLKIHAMESIKAGGTAHSNVPGTVATVGNTMAVQGMAGWATQLNAAPRQ